MAELTQEDIDRLRKTILAAKKAMKEFQDAGGNIADSPRLQGLLARVKGISDDIQKTIKERENAAPQP